MEADAPEVQAGSTPDYNLPSPSTLIIPGIRHGGPINLDPETIEPLDDSGRGLFIGRLVGRSADEVVRGGGRGWVAVKQVEDGRPRVPRDMRREAELLGKMDHPNVLALLNAYLLPSPSAVPCNMFLLFTPLYPYTLSTLVSSSQFIPSPSSPADFSTVAHSLAWQMLSAVAYLHQEHIAHRDISPANFVLSHEGRAVLIDFGISIRPGDEEPGAMHFEVGTGPYRAPELLFGTSDYDPFALDLWALAATLAEFFTPFGLPDPPSPPSVHSDDDEAAQEGRWGEEDLERELGGGTGAFAPPIPTRQTLFDGSRGDFTLVGSIFRIIGTPTIETWPEAALLADFSRLDFLPFPPTPLLSLLPYLDETSPLLSTFEGMLKCSAGQRMSAKNALETQGWEGVRVLFPDDLKREVWTGDAGDQGMGEMMRRLL